MIYDDNGVSLFHHYLSNDLWWSARETSEPHAIRRQFSPASTFQWRDRWPGQLFVVWWPQKMHAANGYFMWFNMAITIWFAFNIAKYGKKTWQKTCMAKKHCKKTWQKTCKKPMLSCGSAPMGWSQRNILGGRFRIVQPKKKDWRVQPECDSIKDNPIAKKKYVLNKSLKPLVTGHG